MKIDLETGLTEKELQQPVSEYMERVDTAFPLDLTIEGALESLRSKTISTQATYFYALDNKGLLHGFFSSRDLLFCDPKTPLKKIVDTGIIKVQEDDTMEKALMQIVDHQLMAMPVVDNQGRLKGIVEVIPPTLGEVVKTNKIRSRFSSDFFQLIGMSVGLGKASAGLTEYYSRMPWLLCNIVSGLICAMIADIYQVTLIKIVILAMFIPLVLTLSESIAVQSMSLCLQFLHRAGTPWRLLLKRLFVELKASFLLGLTSAIIVGLAYLLFSLEYMPMIAITVSILFSMIAASVFGMAFPVMLHTLSLDPKVSAGPLVLMVTDIAATAIYLIGSTWWLLKGSGL